MVSHPLYDKVTHAFQSRFQHSPQLVVRAPGRVNLIGEHTDYNDGFVLPVAVDRAVWLAVTPQSEAWATIRALDMRNDEKTFPVDRVPSSAGGWDDYPKGVVWAYLEQMKTLSGIQATLTSDVPIGAGMSSSAALELAFAYTWNHLEGFEISRDDLALMCQKAENQYVGVNCGIMDQMISACGKAGHAMFLDTRTLERNYCPIPEGIAIVVADSLVRRSLASSEYNVRRGQCEQAVRILKEYLPKITALRDVTPDELNRFGQHLPDVVLRRARHVVTENARVLLFAKALYQHDVTALRTLMVEGHRSLRDDYEVSAPELDTLVEATLEVPGCYGARLTGAGFGGCIVALVAENAVSEVEKHVVQIYANRYGQAPKVYITRPANGVEVIS
ncbi:MAG: galactokinase [Anaerolineae bacterium]|nr:galactokinase [Anaerolineae bacterium]